MPLKPNVLEDLARDVRSKRSSRRETSQTLLMGLNRSQHHITAPATRRKYHSPSDEIMLEDESGRVRLVGSKVDDAEGTFVTGDFRLFVPQSSLSLTPLIDRHHHGRTRRRDGLGRL